MFKVITRFKKKLSLKEKGKTKKCVCWRQTLFAYIVHILWFYYGI